MKTPRIPKRRRRAPALGPTAHRQIAMVVREYRGCEINLGRLVLATAHGGADDRHGPMYLIEPLHGQTWAWLDEPDDRLVHGPMPDQLYLPGAWLMPLGIDAVPGT